MRNVNINVVFWLSFVALQIVNCLQSFCIQTIEHYVDALIVNSLYRLRKEVNLVSVCVVNFKTIMAGVSIIKDKVN